MTQKFAAFVLLLLLSAAMVEAQQEPIRATRNPFNPPALEKFKAPPSATIRYWLSPAGVSAASSSRHPNLLGLLKRFGVTAETARSARGTAPRRAPVWLATSRVAPCVGSGNRFNLQPAAGMPDIGLAAPINDNSVDFLPGGGRKGADLIVAGADDFRGVLQPGATMDGSYQANPMSWGLSGTGYYVARDGGCGASFEGGLPHLEDPAGWGELYGLGEATVAVDATRGNVYESDIRISLGTTAVGLFRTTAARLNNEAACPSGIHLLDQKAQDTVSGTCWPVGVLVGTSDQAYSLVDAPHIRADERSGGAGAGDLYVVWSLFQITGLAEFVNVIQISACKAEFTSSADCSAPVTISGADVAAAFPYVAVRPDGIVTVTYFNAEQKLTGMFTQTDVIRHVACSPRGAPLAPVCSVPTTVAVEKQPVVFAVAGQAFNVSTRPVHAIRTRSGVVEEVVTWARCKQSPFVPIGSGEFEGFGVCPDADVVFTISATDAGGAPVSWSDPQPVNDRPGDQFFPSIAWDETTGMTHIQYYSSEADPAHHRVQLLVNSLAAGEYGAGAPRALINTLNETDADPLLRSNFFGNKTGLASRAGRSYSATTQNWPLIYDGMQGFGQTNVLTLFGGTK